jgi:hypothetical protein
MAAVTSPILISRSTVQRAADHLVVKVMDLVNQSTPPSTRQGCVKHTSWVRTAPLEAGVPSHTATESCDTHLRLPRHKWHNCNHLNIRRCHRLLRHIRSSTTSITVLVHHHRFTRVHKPHAGLLHLAVALRTPCYLRRVACIHETRFLGLRSLLETKWPTRRLLRSVSATSRIPPQVLFSRVAPTEKSNLSRSCRLWVNAANEYCPFARRAAAKGIDRGRQCV